MVLNRPSPSDSNDDCDLIDMTPNERRAFVADERENDQLDNIAFSELMNCVVLVLTVVAIKLFWEYPPKTRSDDIVFAVFAFSPIWVERTLKTYPGDYILRYYHADGGAELITKALRRFYWMSTERIDVTSLHVLFNESVSEGSSDYFKELSWLP